jgi:hypothetical protein
MDVHVASRMLLENIDGSLLVLGIPRPYPEQQASMV